MNEDATDPVKAELTATAYHEAGHAVMAMAVGRPIEKVNVTPRKMLTGGTRLGICHLQSGRSKSSKDWIDETVLVLFAGMIAEARYTGRYCRQGAAEDLRAIKRLLVHRASDERQLERAQQRLLAKAEHLLEDTGHALAIEWIARELIERGSVSGKAVRHFFDLALKQSS